MSDLGKCRCCEVAEADYECPDCGEPTCEDCFEPITQFNAGSPTRCEACVGSWEATARADSAWEEDFQKKRDAERDLRNRKARERYRRPENVEKRRLARDEKRKRDAEIARDTLVQAFKIIGEFKGMG